MKNHSLLDCKVFEPLENKWLGFKACKRRVFRVFISIVLSAFVFTAPMLLFVEFEHHIMLFLTQFLLGSIVLYIMSLLLTAVARNRREFAVLNVELQDISLRDSLTGLYNNRQFMIEKLKSMSSDAIKNNEPIAIFFADLDGLKEINDNISHPAGDSALVATAKRMGNVLRDSDMLFRFGGDEFFAISQLKNTTEEDAEDEIIRIAQRLSDSVSSKPIRFLEDKIPLSISIGAHILNIENTIERELLIVDKKMYAIKEKRKKEK